MQRQYKYLSLLSVIAVFFSVIYISCNKEKGSLQTTTVVYNCTATSCLNGSTCDAVTGKCVCTAGFEGTHCETKSRDKFISNWQVSEKGSVSSATLYTVTIQPATNDEEVTISNFNNYFLNPVLANIVSDSIYISSQAYYGKIIIGKGFIHSGNFGPNSAITLRYQITDTATMQVNDFGYTPADSSLPSLWSK